MTTCYVCEAPDDTDRHHIIPVTYNGPKDGKTVDLCPRCHRLVHRAAEHYAKNGEYTKNFNAITDAEQRKRALILIRYIVNAKNTFETSGVIADDARNMVQISCTAEELALFHSVKTQLGMKSLSRAIKAIMIQQYQKQLGVKNHANYAEPVQKPSATTVSKQKRRRKVHA